MEQGNQFLLNRRLQIDQKVPASDQVHPGEGRILGQIMASKDAQVTNSFAYLVAVLEFHEETSKPFGREFRLNVLWVDSSASLLDGWLAQVRGENLHGNTLRFLAQVLEYADTQGIGFLTRGASRHPQPKALLTRFFLDEIGQHRCLERLEELRIAEKGSNGDQNI